MSYRVTTQNIGRIVLNEVDEIRSVLQNVSIILRTWRGTVPLYRQFGTDFNFLDKPLNVASPIIYADIKEAIEEFEPRAEVVSIRFIINPDHPGALIPEVEVMIS